MQLPPVGLQLVAQHNAVGQEDGEARALVYKGEKPQLCAQLAVVALFGLLNAEQVSVQLFFVRESDGVNTLQHFVFSVATPVGAGKAQHGGCFNQAGGRQVRAAAEVGEISLGVGADDGVLWQIVN